MSLWRRGRSRLVTCVLGVALVVGGAARAFATASLFDLADGSSAIAYGRVTAVETYDEGTFQVFTIEPEQVLTGALVVGEAFRLVQERLFETSKPYFSAGVRTLVFAKPLPPYTLYKQHLPEGAHLQWTDRLDTAADLVTLRDPALVQPVAGYLSAREDPEALARHLGGLTASSVPRLRAGALDVLEGRPDLPPLLDAEALGPLDAFLVDERVPLASRADSLVRLGRVRAAGIGPLAEATAARGGPLRAAAVDALVSVGHLPSETRLLADSRSPDEALRLAALRGLIKVGTPTALTRVEEMVQGDSEPVRYEGLRRLGDEEGPVVVAILTDAIGGDDERAGVIAAESLGREHSAAALEALEQALLTRGGKVRVAAAFALKQSGTRRGVEFLRAQSRGHPDHEVQQICKLALGLDTHEH